MSELLIRGARTHNLKNLDLALPLGKIVGITGRSGSGKSSLAFDTIHAETFRRFLQVMSASERSRMRALDRPNVDLVQGIGISIALAQAQPVRQRLATVGAFAEIHELVHSLYAAHGRAHCTKCGQEVSAQSEAAMLDDILLNFSNQKIQMIAPLRDREQLGWGLILESLVKQGFTRVRIDGSLQNLPLPKQFPLQTSVIEIVIDRIVAGTSERERLRDSLALALRTARGVVLVESEHGKQRSYTEHNYCWPCDIVYPDLSPSLFQLSNAQGRCPSCSGTGVESADLENEDGLDFLELACASCQGTRLNPFARALIYREIDLGSALTSEALTLHRFVEQWSSGDLSQVEREMLALLAERLKTMQELKLGEIGLNRALRTLSTGEFQRLRLVQLLNTSLQDAFHILDEPSLGAHPSEKSTLLGFMDRLKSKSAGVMIVEHDQTLLKHCDWIVDLGPGAGKDGGYLLKSCASSEFFATSLTRNPEIETDAPKKVAPGNDLISIRALNDRARSLVRNLDFSAALWTNLSGKSGSGKSLILSVVFNAAHSKRYASEIKVSGLERFKHVVAVDAEPLRAGSRSLVATYLDIFGPLRTLFAATAQARARGWTAAYFALQQKGGRCEACEGAGVVNEEFAWGDAPRALCGVCAGRRYQLDTEQVRYRGWSIADILALDAQSAISALDAIPSIAQPLHSLIDVGLQYLPLGQATNTLSGGEAQRLKFARELVQRANGEKLFLFDFPSQGLSREDLPTLIGVLRKLVAQGHTTLTADHHATVIEAADAVIDLDL